MTFATLVDVLAWRAQNQPTRRAFTFLADGDVDRSVHLTYEELDRQARTTAARIRASAEIAGRPVLLLFPPGLDVLVALFGCFYAGGIATIADFPRRRSSLSPLESTLRDAGVTLGLTSALADIEPYLAHCEPLKRLRWLSVEESIRSSSPASPDAAAPDPHSTAVLQYTSGSTGTPRGVMVSHGNLVHNSGLIHRQFRQTENSRTVFWLPLSHDMGLVGGVCQPLYGGYDGTLMSPLAFLQRPIRWLQAITALRATTSAAPNFAYDLCVRRTTAAQRDGLDLSSWTVAINGAEPVRARTLERFAEVFGPCGFRPEAFCPSYGLAEATLLVSGQKRDAPPTIVTAATNGFERIVDGDALTVGCGRVAPEQKVVVVHPELAVQARPAEIGEIWVAGKSVTRGYWNRPEETQATFGAYLSDSGEGPFLRTGDLGYIAGDELFITARWKDLVIVRGVNYSPEGIEQTVEKAHPSLRAAGGAVFGVPVNGEERLVVVHELERSFLRTVDKDEVFRAIQEAVSEAHELEVHGIVLIQTGSLPKTATRKTRRQACREAYLDQSLKAVAAWSSDRADHGGAEQPAAKLPSPEARDRESAVRTWLVEKLSRQLKIPAAEMDVRRPLGEYGFDSAAVVGLAGDLEDYLGRELRPDLVYDYPTIEALSIHLAGSPREQDAGKPRVG
jgi:acyl-CoA synthetase (AMP-forming)/AMP-acid ligase II/acyl carrier protein